MVLRDKGEAGGAATALDQALDVCERAGLVAQSVQVTAARAVVLAGSGHLEQAREAAGEAHDLAERLSYPLGQAAAMEARGAVSDDPDEGAALLAEAGEAWTGLGRPLEAARCRILAGRLLLPHDSERAAVELQEAAAAYERLGVPHLAEAARAAV